MNISQSFRLALKSLATSKMRALLTMLGIIIGVAAVIIITSLGNGMQLMMNAQFEKLGANLVQVQLMQTDSSSRTITPSDMEELVEKYPQYLSGMTPYISVQATVFHNANEYKRTRIMGVSEAFLNDQGSTMSGEELGEGRFLKFVDVDRYQNVCVIGAYLNQAYFGGNGVGQTLRVGGQSLEVVGVLTQQDDELEEGGSDDCLYLPYTTAERISGEASSYTITMKNEDYIDESVAALESALYEVFASDDYYTVTSMAEMLETMTSMINILVGVLAGIAAISLVVGGIGIMNIMLVSVTERTREIGIRKSLGAKERYIMQQFVIEAATTSALGGVIGILLGYGLSQIATAVVARLMEESLTISPTMGAVLLAFGISVGIGIFFGYLPAKKAAQLNPIDALHYD